MTQPDDATEALPTHHLPIDPAAGTARHGTPPPPVPAEEPTVHLSGADSTVYLGQAEPTVHLSGVEPTVYLAGTESTAPGNGGEPTARLAGTGSAVEDQGVAGRTATDTAGTSGVRTSRGTLPAPIAGPGGELRFGPGVPVAPPPAPAWPTPVPPARRRSAGRRLVSLLSTLLTLALLAAVGLWIWQRLSPLEITEVSVVVPSPAGARCDVSIDVVATVRTNGRAGTIQYQWLRSGSAPGTLLDERVGWGQRSVELTLRWSFSGVGTTTETATVNIVSPAPTQASAEVVYSCPG
ncbi:hypothetical protein Vqi01_26470 [Micromonospora qiuiae]|uniref:Ig-like domain-containing protein n=1 Tax=Micromonospora qiuiae TaxID=502268 RepID=A0ABQ4JBZ0_9ACTN|nr:hypothetical protein [Micromonospora qiuiae]GIJ27485.1 hypothetical protein Vqi01_26470 [Micromonospora qiuiae]